MSGASYGLSLDLNIEPEDYLKGGQVRKKVVVAVEEEENYPQTAAVGARVSVQERNAYPLVTNL